MSLKNKLNLTDSAQLASAEEKISKKKALSLFESGYLHTLQAGTLDSLISIHKYLFEDIYDFAGKVREVNLAKGNFRFAPVAYLNEALKNIEQMNAAHPFREGNGRAMRIWLDLMLQQELKMVVDWSLIDKEDYLLAMERSPIRDIEIKYLLRRALTDRINDREVYMKGIDHSYYYEGYTAYRTEELLNE